METAEKTEEFPVKEAQRRLPGTVNWGTATVVGIFAGGRCFTGPDGRVVDGVNLNF